MEPGMESEDADRIISRLEDRNDVEVVFASEEGSRGTETFKRDSDYDLLLLYAPSRLEMATGDEPESLEFTADKLDWQAGEKPTGVDPGKVEVTGFSVRKFSEMILNGKEAFISDMTESLNSSVVYRGEGFEQLTDYLASNFDPLTAFNHYNRMAEKFVNDGISDRKNLLRAARTVSHAHYILETGKFPDQNFYDFLEDLPEELQSSDEESEELYNEPSEFDYQDFSDLVQGQIEERRRSGDEFAGDDEAEDAANMVITYFEKLEVSGSAYGELAKRFADRSISGDELADTIQSALVESPHYGHRTSSES